MIFSVDVNTLLELLAIARDKGDITASRYLDLCALAKFIDAEPDLINWRIGDRSVCLMANFPQSCWVCFSADDEPLVFIPIADPRLLHSQQAVLDANIECMTVDRARLSLLYDNPPHGLLVKESELDGALYEIARAYEV